jgi:hypothetical protein
MPIFELVGLFFFQNDVNKVQEDFLELWIRVFLENGLGCFQAFLILQILGKPEVIKSFQKQFCKLDSKSKKSRKLLFSEKNLVVPFRSHSIRAFLVVLEDSLRIISET